MIARLRALFIKVLGASSPLVAGRLVSAALTFGLSGKAHGNTIWWIFGGVLVSFIGVALLTPLLSKPVVAVLGTLDEAISAFAAAGSAARILAGGTDLLVQMRSGAVKPGLIVDIKKIAEMTAIEQTKDGGFRIGAATSGMALAEHNSFGKIWPGVLLPLTVAYVWRTRGRREALVCLGVVAGVVVAVVLPFLVIAPHGVWTSFTRQLSRPLQIESIGAALIVASHHVFGRWSTTRLALPCERSMLPASTTCTVAVTPTKLLIRC